MTQLSCSAVAPSHQLLEFLHIVPPRFFLLQSLLGACCVALSASRSLKVLLGRYQGARGLGDASSLMCYSLLGRIRRALGVSSRALCRLLPAITTSQSMRPARSPLWHLIASLAAAASTRRLYKSLGDVEKLGSSLEIRNKGLDVGTSCWGYL